MFFMVIQKHDLNTDKAILSICPIFAIDCPRGVSPCCVFPLYLNLELILERMHDLTHMIILRKLSKILRNI